MQAGTRRHSTVFREIKQALNVETALVQTQSPADFEDSLRDFASRGFNIVFAHGFEYTDAALKVGKLFPKTWFIVTSGSGSAASVFQAAVQSHIYAFGANSDQNAVAPDNVLASAVTHIPKAFVRIATEIKSGEFRGGMLEYGMKEGMVELVYNPRLQSKITAATSEKAKEAERQIIAGKIVLE
jgi:basic membrane lipoprotein Med (substrate-binding protein (PBP1-ABC) superfamily)